MVWLKPVQRLMGRQLAAWWAAPSATLQAPTAPVRTTPTVPLPRPLRAGGSFAGAARPGHTPGLPVLGGCARLLPPLWATCTQCAATLPFQLPAEGLRLACIPLLGLCTGVYPKGCACSPDLIHHVHMQSVAAVMLPSLNSLLRTLLLCCILLAGGELLGLPRRCAKTTSSAAQLCSNALHFIVDHAACLR